MMAVVILVCSLILMLQFFVSYCRSLIAASAKDLDRGRDAFEKRCTGCHALDKIKVVSRRRLESLPARLSRWPPAVSPRMRLLVGRPIP